MIATVTLNVAIDKRYVIEHYQYGTVMRVKSCNYTAGGKGLNVSRVAKLAGEEVVATGFIGGHAGNYVVEQLEKDGIACSFTRVSGETRSCVNLYDQETRTQTEFLEPGVVVSPEQVELFVTNYCKVIQPCAVVCISGSVPMGVDAAIYQRLVQIAKSAGKKVLLDTSGDLLCHGIQSKPSMIKPNCDEIKALIGMETTDRKQLLQAAQKIQADGIEVVVVSLGKDGALAICEEGIFQGVTPDIPVVNTVGCGDSMVAAFAVGFARQQPISEILKSAMAISTANALCLETGFFLEKDYQRLLQEVQVFRL